jgi:tetratricopeptide (TPR) repeat protein
VEGKEDFVARTLEDEECAICLQIVADEIDFQLPCGHWFHRECVKQLERMAVMAVARCAVSRYLQAPKKHVIGRFVSFCVEGCFRRGKARSQLDERRWEAASPDNQKEDPGYEHAYGILGLALSDQGHLVGATAAYTQAFATGPDDGRLAEQHSNLGNALYRQRDYAGAVAAWKRAIAIDPHHSNSHCNLGNALRTQGNLADAYKQAIAIDPNHLGSHCSLGIVLRRQGDHAGAAAAHKQIIPVGPNRSDAFSGLGTSQAITQALSRHTSGRSLSYIWRESGATRVYKTSRAV